MHQHIGYGTFQLRDLLTGEDFARFDGTHCRVSEYAQARSPYIAVRVDIGTLNERTEWLHATAQIHAISRGQAVRIRNRIRRRTQRKEKKS